MKKQLLYLLLMLTTALGAICQTTTLYTQGNITINNTSGITVSSGSLFTAASGGTAVTNIASANLATTEIVIGSGNTVTTTTAISIGYLTFSGGTLAPGAANVNVTNTLSGTGNISQPTGGAAFRLGVSGNVTNANLTSTGAVAANIAILGASVIFNGVNVLPPLTGIASGTPASPSTFTVTLTGGSITTTALIGFSATKTLAGDASAKLTLNAGSTISPANGSIMLSRLTITSATGVNILANGGSVTIKDTLSLGGNSTFTINSGSTLAVASNARIIRSNATAITATAGIFTVPNDGTVNVEYSNTADLTTASELPATVNSLTINGVNADVTLNTDVTVGTYNGNPASGIDTLKIASGKKLKLLGVGTIVTNSGGSIASRIMAANSGASLEIANTSGTVVLPTTAIASLNSTTHSNLILNNSGGVLSLSGRNPVVGSNLCTVNLGNVTFNAGSSLLLDAELPSTSTRILPIVNGTLTGSCVYNIASSNISAASRLSLGDASTVNDFSYTTSSSAQIAQFGTNITMSGTVTLPTSFVFNSSNSGTSTSANVTLSPGANITIAGLSMNGSQNTTKKFLGSPTTNLTITGTTRTSGVNAGGALVFDQTGTNNQLFKLTIGSGAKTDSINIGSNLTVLDTLTLTRGTLYPTAGNTLVLDATTGVAVFDSAAVLSIPATAIVNFNSRPVTLKSRATGTATITTISGTLSGASNVTVERYIPFQRGYRTFGHPFTTGQTLAGLNNAFAITGSGTGFNSSSQSSIFRYDSSVASGSGTVLVGLSNSPNTISSVVWGAGQGLYAFVRGSGTQGINFNYIGGKTPATASNTGTINQGDLADYALGTANYTLVGNPYPSAINIKNVNSNGNTALSGNTNVYSTIYVYNPYKNAGGDTVLRGGFDSYINNGTNDIIIPSGGAFYIKAIAAGQVLKFTEASKSTSTALTIFGEGSGTPGLKLGIESNKGSWDDVIVNLYDNGTSKSTDRYDGIKLSNQLFDLYSLSSDGTKLCIDSRSNNLSSEQIIPLGIRTNEVGTDFKFTLQQNSLPSNAKVVLRDKLLQQEVVLDKDFSGYTFAMSSDTATKGNYRFELVVNGTAAGIISNPQDQVSFVSFNASPNPFRDLVTVSLDKTATTSTRVSILNILGQSLQSKVVAAGTSNVQFSLNGESAGTYFVRVSTDKGEYTHKIVKQ